LARAYQVAKPLIIWRRLYTGRKRLACRDPVLLPGDDGDVELVHTPPTGPA
jgi:hypothetical protein